MTPLLTKMARTRKGTRQQANERHILVLDRGGWLRSAVDDPVTTERVVSLISFTVDRTLSGGGGSGSITEQ